MKDVISLTKSGKTLGFPIQSLILEDLGLKPQDPVEVEIFLEYKGKASFIIVRRLRKIGSSFGISIRKYIVEELNLNKGDSLQVDIRKTTSELS